MSDYRRAGRAFFDFAAAVLFGYLLLRPSLAGGEVKNAVKFCVEVIIPSLFVFLVLSKLVLGQLITLAGRALPFALIISGAVSGFPVGAKIIRELYENGSLSKKQAELLLSCSDNASVSFIVSFAGAGVLGSLRAGLLLFWGKLLISALWYFAASKIYLLPWEREFLPGPDYPKSTLPQAIKDASRTMAEICAAIVFFMCLSGVITRFLPANEYVQSFVRGFFEFSGGIGICGRMPPGAGYVVTAMLIGWSGICVHMQVSLSAGKELSLKLYTLNKSAECFLMGVFAVLTKGFAF